MSKVQRTVYINLYTEKYHDIYLYFLSLIPNKFLLRTVFKSRCDAVCSKKRRIRVGSRT